MKMDRHTETSAFSRDVAEKKILKALVFVVRGRNLSDEVCIDTCGVRPIDFLKGQRSQVCGFEFLGERSTLPVMLERRSDDESEVVVQRFRCSRYSDTGEESV